ncbi:DMT family transporter [Aquicoccus porphyridii]|uniref:DMT family transporter n=1 Tax=Aquicoccus porphyridii TaxID=1852029 RepID=A0A5A9YXQ2_9RHOB|nr:DMT family transporter [Aquicoccus porphyridii]KAA0909618.1 DMT family transporter [Aquicoccus porphyridii]RAI51884.1 EamA/RhaT family transporter [Rhodobacteraceae bacterium AsT-22]
MLIILRNTLSGLGWAIVAITVWSGSLVMLRLGMTTSLNAYDLTVLRFGVAALILAPVAMRRGIGTDRLGLTGLLAMVVTFGAPYVLLIALAMKSAPAAAAGALNPGVMAIVSVLLGRMILGDRIGGTRFIGLAATATGIVLFTRAGGAVTTSHLILIGTGIMWASYTLIVRRAAVPALNATAIVAVGSAVFYLPIYIVALPKQILTAPLADVLMQAGFQGVLVSVVAIYAFNRSAELLGPVAGATLPALIPVGTLGLGVVVLGETAGAGEFASAILVTMGLALILVGRPAMRWLSSHIPRGLNKKGHSLGK